MVCKVRINRRTAVLSAILGSIVLSQSAVAASSAPISRSEEVDVELTFIESAVSIEYGQGWSFEIWANHEMYFTDGSNGETELGVFPTLSGKPDYDVSVYLPSPHHLTPTVVLAYLGPDPAAPALDAGEYTIDATAEGAGFGYFMHAKSSSPARLTIKPAPLGLDVRVVADPNNPAGAIVTTVFTGQFADNYYPSSDIWAPIAPTGTLSITLADDQGEVVSQRNIERHAGDGSLSTTFYWSDATPGTTYTATAEFDSTGQTANNFEISEAGEFTFTPAGQRPVATSTAVAAPPSEELPDAGFGLPLWLVILAAIAALCLAVLTTIFSVRAARTTPAPKESVDAN